MAPMLSVARWLLKSSDKFVSSLPGLALDALLPFTSGQAGQDAIKSTQINNFLCLKQPTWPMTDGVMTMATLDSQEKMQYLARQFTFFPDSFLDLARGQ